VKAPVKTGMEVVVKVHYVVRHSKPLRPLGGCSSEKRDLLHPPSYASATRKGAAKR